ncbi:MAG: quinone oxidoreductase family protein [Ktedonobacteraceae bacterium]
MKASRVHELGDPDVMRLEDIEKPAPREGEILIQVAAVGINYADLSQRQGTYMTHTHVPMTPGLEVAGTVVELGPGVSVPAVGTRVAAFANGGYAEYATAAASAVLPIPSHLDFSRAAAFPVQGLTAYQLLRESARLEQGESVLVHAAAGGVGTLAVQLARLMGAGKVLGTASSASKLELVSRLGADAAINYTEENWVEQVKQATDGKGADIILEMVGGQIAEQSLQALANYGRMVVFGRASGEVAQFTGVQLMYKNQAIIGYWLSAWMQRPDRIARAVSELMRYLANGQLEIIVGATFPLAEAAAAHRAIAARQTTGKVVLLV